MKKYILIFSLTLCSVTVSVAQSVQLDNALQFSQNIYEGTARFQAMGGAFAALGGDFTTLSINPAGIGVYRSSEFSLTPVLAIANTSAGYMGNTIDDSKTRFGLGNFSFVAAVPTYNIEGLMAVNFGVGFNKLQNNTQRFSAGARTSKDANLSYLRHLAMGLSKDKILEADFDAKATDEEWLAMKTGLLDPIGNHDGNYIGATEARHPQYRDSLELIYQMGDVDQLLYHDQSGYVGEYAFSTGINLSDLFYFGLSLGIQEINHSLYEEYQERAVNVADFDAVNGVGFQRLIYSFSNETKGIGYNLKFGAIARPIGGLRVGAYIHTPTWMYLHEHWMKDMTSVLKSGKRDANIEPSDYYYRVQAPFRWGAGLAYTFGSMGLISVDYEGVGYSSLKLREDNGSFGSFAEDNRHLDDYYRPTTTNIRVGGELRLNAIALRAGYAYYQNPGKEMKAVQIGSVGIGYRGEYFFIDGAYSFSPNNTQLRDLYAGNPNIVSTSTFLSKIAITVGWRF